VLPGLAGEIGRAPERVAGVFVEILTLTFAVNW
jgi:hypothetical protein